MTRVGVLVGPKGRGTNMSALVRAGREGRMPAQVVAVAAPSSTAPALDLACSLAVPCHVVPYEPSDSFGNRLVETFQGCDLICLAGFMRVLPKEVLDAFPDRVLNIHPSLLPDFGGKGMYGMKVHEAVITAGVQESGCTVHLVNEKYDEGRILVQRRVQVQQGDTAEDVAARVLDVEQLAYAEAVTLRISELGP